MLIERLLLLACLGIIDSRLVALCQRVECLDAPALGKPVLLPGGGHLVRLRHDFPRLRNGRIQFVEE